MFHFYVWMKIFPSVGLCFSLCVSFSLPPGSMLKSWLPTLVFPPRFIPVSAFSGTCGDSYHRSLQLERQLGSSEIIPACKVSAGALGVVSFTKCFPPTSSPTPGAAVWVLRPDLCSSAPGHSRPPLTHPVGCEVSLAGLPAPSGIGVRVSQLHLAPDLPWNAWARGGRRPTGLRKTSVPLPILCLSLFSA